MNPNYREKFLEPLSDQQFKEGMIKGTFVRSPKHQGLVTFLFYSAVRISEALAMKREQFSRTPTRLFCDVGARLKHSRSTPPLEIPLDAPYVDYLVDSVLETKKKKKRVWPYCRKTGYNIVNRVFHYPHYFRLSRITILFLKGFTIPELQSYTGLSLNSLNYYIGTVAISRMGDSLKPKS